MLSAVTTHRDSFVAYASGALGRHRDDKSGLLCDLCIWSAGAPSDRDSSGALGRHRDDKQGSAAHLRLCIVIVFDSGPPLIMCSTAVCSCEIVLDSGPPQYVRH